MTKTAIDQPAATSLGRYLMVSRVSAGLTQQQAAERFGVSRKSVINWERGQQVPPLTILPRLVDVYGVGPADLTRAMREGA